MHFAKLLAALALVAAAQPAGAADGSLRRFAIVAGASLGGSTRTPLRYAMSDARDVSRILRRLGGVAPGDLVLLEEPDAEAIRAALSSIAPEVERTRAAGRRAELFLYYSGHSDEEGLLLGSSRLPYAELRSALAGVPADVRVAILDSCASGAFTRAKGGVHRPPFLVDESNRVQGHAFLTSSAATEASQESDRLRASFFTHSLLTGLQGAADASGDAVVTLNEAYQFAFRETLARTETTQGGPQHPTYDIGLVGSGDVVMTDLRSADALLVMPESLDGRVFVRNGAGQLVAELRKTKGTRVELALEDGRYEVKVARDRVLAGTVEIVSSARVVLDEAQLTPAKREPTFLRGGDGEPIAETPLANPRQAPSGSDGSRRVGWSLARAGPGLFLAGGTAVGFGIDVAVGTWFNDSFGAEVASGYHEVSGNRNGRLPALGPLSTVNDNLRTIPTTLTLKMALARHPFRPYLLAGAGLHVSRVDRRPAADASVTPGAVPVRDDDAYLAFHVGFGATARLRRNAFAAIEARYGWDADARMFEERYAVRALHLSGGVGYSF